MATEHTVESYALILAQAVKQCRSMSEHLVESQDYRHYVRLCRLIHCYQLAVVAVADLPTVQFSFYLYEKRLLNRERYHLSASQHYIVVNTDGLQEMMRCSSHNDSFGLRDGIKTSRCNILERLLHPKLL